MPELSARVMTFTDSVIRRMTRISNQYGAINLSQGFPDFDPPRVILDELARVAYDGPHQYSITFGAQNLREAIARKYEHFSGQKVDPNTQIVVTCGSTEAMMTAMMTVCNPGDKVVVFSPFYENYGADAILSGADPIYVPLTPPDFSFDRDVLRAAFAQKPKALILCNPSNPTGKVFTREELTYIAGLAIEFDTFVITDEVYEHIVFAPYHHEYMAALPGMAERTITCNSLSKTYSITGWRLGYMIAPPEVAEAAKKVHDFLTVGAPAPLQEAAVTGISFDDDYYRSLQDLYTEKRNFFCDGLKKLGLSYTVPQGTYFVLMDISDFLTMPQFAGWSDLAFCEWMIREIGVAAVPGSSFFRENVNHLVRFHFARGRDVLQQALDRLAKLAAMLPEHHS